MSGSGMFQLLTRCDLLNLTGQSLIAQPQSAFIVHITPLYSSTGFPTPSCPNDTPPIPTSPSSDSHSSRIRFKRHHLGVQERPSSKRRCVVYVRFGRSDPWLSTTRNRRAIARDVSRGSAWYHSPPQPEMVYWDWGWRKSRDALQRGACCNIWSSR